MIDEYGNEQTIGSKEFEEYLHHRMDKEFCNDIACGDMNKELALRYANEFFGYALDLQEEVKRLREELQRVCSHVDYSMTMTGFVCNTCGKEEEQ
jgi:hypothetical protein